MRSHRTRWTSVLVVVAASIAHPARAADGIFLDGYETLTPAQLVVHYPAGAQSISARGDGGGLSWSLGVPFARDGNTFTLTLMLSGGIEWKPLLDDTTYALGPNYSVRPGQTAEIWPHFTTTAGQVVTLISSFQSTVLGNSRPIYAYLPPTYVENTEASFPVVYMQDGQNLYAAHPEWAFGGVTWAVDSTFDTAAGDGTIAEAIVIGVANSANRIYEYTPTDDPDVAGGGGADLYLQMLVDELKPTVDGMLRTRPGVATTLIAGSSLGGLAAAYAGRARPTVFGRVAALSPSSWWDDAVIVDLVQTTPAAPQRPLAVYVDSGDGSNDSVTTTTALAQAYGSVGYVTGVNLLHVVQPGGMHSETFWAQRFPGAMAFLLGPGR